MAYVIKSWQAGDHPDTQNNFVTITGRNEGFISWLLALFRIEPTFSIVISESSLEISEVSLSGSIRRLIPLPNVCSTVYGYSKPWKKALVLGIFLTFMVHLAITANYPRQVSFGTSFTAIMIGLIISLVYYFLNRTLTLGFVEHSGIVNAIEFKRSVIENKDINEAQAGYVCQVVQALIDAHQRKTP
jgi:hypothetical protein